MRQNIESDAALRRLRDELRGTRYPLEMRAIAHILLGNHTGPTAMIHFRLAQYWMSIGRSWLAKCIQNRLRKHFGCYISLTADIGPRLKLPHPVGIVIGNGVRIGSDCTIFQHVTLGGGKPGDHLRGAYPIVGSGVTIFTGACVIGAVEVGSQAIIAANAVVRSAVPQGAVAAGVPAVMKLAN